jgi:hypothetical protein
VSYCAIMVLCDVVAVVFLICPMLKYLACVLFCIALC